MIVVKLFDDLTLKEDVPYWWTNFVDDVRVFGGLKKTTSIDEINTMLASYGARFCAERSTHGSWGKRSLEFKNEEDLTYFIMRWS